MRSSLSVQSFALVCSLVLVSGCSEPQSPAASDPAPSGPGRGSMVMSNVIVITNSGSTNTIGYRILIAANGEASYVSGDGAGRAVLPEQLHAQLKADVAAAAPLSQMPVATGCVKSASFGTSVDVALGGEHSPDLTCPGSEAARKLKDDVDAVVAFLKIRNTPRSEGKELPPQNL